MSLLSLIWKCYTIIIIIIYYIIFLHFLGNSQVFLFAGEELLVTVKIDIQHIFRLSIGTPLAATYLKEKKREISASYKYYSYITNHS